MHNMNITNKILKTCLYFKPLLRIHLFFTTLLFDFIFLPFSQVINRQCGYITLKYNDSILCEWRWLYTSMILL